MQLRFLDLSENEIRDFDERACAQEWHGGIVCVSVFTGLRAGELPRALEYLRLCGNPCAVTDGYRERLIFALPKLQVCMPLRVMASAACRCGLSGCLAVRLPACLLVCFSVGLLVCQSLCLLHVKVSVSLCACLFAAQSVDDVDITEAERRAVNIVFGRMPPPPEVASDEDEAGEGEGGEAAAVLGDAAAAARIREAEAAIRAAPFDAAGAAAARRSALMAAAPAGPAAGDVTAATYADFSRRRAELIGTRGRVCVCVCVCGGGRASYPRVSR